jgi:hypothetical protein
MISPAIHRFRRSELEQWIENAIDLLNALDGDPDLEDTGEDDELSGDEHEPSLGWSNPLGLRVHVAKELKQLLREGL